MAKFDDGQEVQITEVAAVEEVVEEVPQKYKPEQIVTLSSGVRVAFIGHLSDAISQTLVTRVFGNTQLDDSGRIREKMSTREQLQLAKTMLDYNTALIFSGKVRLVDGLPEDNTWVEEIALNPVIMAEHPTINLDNPEHLERLYMRYYAFTGEEDIALLSEKLIRNR